MPTPPTARTSHKRGTVAIVVALTMVSLLGMMAMSIDVAYMYSVEAELQGAVDAAVLAGAAAIDNGPAAVRARTKAFALANKVGGQSLVINDADIVFGDWDTSTGTFTPTAQEADGFAIQITTANTVGLFFGNALGVASSTRSRLATAAFSGGAGSSWDIVVVQDISGSFKDAIQSAKQADVALMQCVRKSTVGSKFGVVSFSTNANDVLAPSGIDTTAEADTVSTAINALSTNGYTNIGEAIANGTAMLTGNTSDLPPAIVLVSDGLPNQGLSECVEYHAATDCQKYKDDNPHKACKKYYKATDCKVENVIYTPEEYGLASADAAAAAGISLYTLYYAGSSSSQAASGSAYLSSLARLDGTSHTNVNPADMETTLKAICRSRFKLRIVE